MNSQARRRMTLPAVLYQKLHKNSDRWKAVRVDTILRFEVCDKYVTAYTAEDQFILNETLGELEALLDAEFIRTHRCHLVRREAISYAYLFENSCWLVMKGRQIHLPVSYPRSFAVLDLLLQRARPMIEPAADDGAWPYSSLRDRFHKTIHSATLS